MARRDLRQVSFADGLSNQRAGRSSWMDEIDKLVDWSAVVKLLDRIYGSDEGRPSYPLLTLVKLLLLQQWYGLSDPGLEEAVDDLAVPSGIGAARPVGAAVRRTQPATRCAGGDPAQGHPDRCHPRRGGGQAALRERRHGVRARSPG